MLVMAGGRHGLLSLLVFIGVHSWLHFLRGDRGGLAILDRRWGNPHIGRTDVSHAGDQS
jgi:hypothetical protein